MFDPNKNPVLFTINEGDDEDERRIRYTELVKALPEKVELGYVSYNDSLTDEQIEMYLTDKYDALWDDMSEWVGDMEHQYADECIDETVKAVTGREYTGDDLDSDAHQYLKEELWERNTFDPVHELASSTRPQLMQIILTEEERERVLDEETINRLSGYVEDYVGIENCCLSILIYGDIMDFRIGRTVTINDPHFALIDAWNGGGPGDIEKIGDGQPFTVELTEDRPAHVDRVLGYGSWDAIAGVVHSYYASDYEAVPTEKEEED